MHVFVHAYEHLEAAIAALDNQDDALAGEVRATASRLWLKLTQPERDHLNKRKETTARLPGTMAEASTWDAFASELLRERARFTGSNEPIAACEAAARRIAQRIRGDR